MKRSAFTLVELMVVVAIIGLISTIAIVASSAIRSRGRDTKRIADLRQVRSALELYYNETSAYPTCGQACTTYCDCTTVGWGGNFAEMEIKPAYMASIPADPINDGTYGYFYARGYKISGNCSYMNTNSPSDYVLATRLENPASVQASCPGGFSAWGRNLNFITGN